VTDKEYLDEYEWIQSMAHSNDIDNCECSRLMEDLVERYNDGIPS
jgi:hypothetical protein